MGVRATVRNAATPTHYAAPDVGNRETPPAASHDKITTDGMGGRIHPWWPTAAVGARRDMIFVQHGFGTERLLI